MTTRNPLQLTDENFTAEVLGSDQPVLVDFWADWCGPCRALAPVVDQLAESHGDEVRIGKVNVDENPETARAWGIQSIPSVLVFRDGEVVDRLVGVHERQRYEDAVNKVVTAA